MLNKNTVTHNVKDWRKDSVIVIAGVFIDNKHYIQYLVSLEEYILTTSSDEGVGQIRMYPETIAIMKKRPR